MKIITFAWKITVDSQFGNKDVCEISILVIPRVRQLLTIKMSPNRQQSMKLLFQAV